MDAASGQQAPRPFARAGVRWNQIDYRHVCIRGDGQCLYRALAYHTGLTWQQMRRELCAAAQICWDEVWPWDARAHLPEFLRETDDDRVWGGAWQIGVAAWKFKALIVVFTEGKEPLTFGEGERV